MFLLDISLPFITDSTQYEHKGYRYFCRPKVIPLERDIFYKLGKRLDLYPEEIDTCLDLTIKRAKDFFSRYKEFYHHYYYPTLLVFLFLLVYKFIIDKPYQNRYLAKLIGLELEVYNRMEYYLLTWLNYRILKIENG